MLSVYAVHFDAIPLTQHPLAAFPRSSASQPKTTWHQHQKSWTEDPVLNTLPSEYHLPSHTDMSSAFNLLTSGGSRFDKSRFKHDIDLFTAVSPPTSRHCPSGVHLSYD